MVVAVALWGCAAEVSPGGDASRGEESQKFLIDLPSETETKVDIAAWFRNILTAIATGVFSGSGSESSSVDAELSELVRKTTYEAAEKLQQENLRRSKDRRGNRECGMVQVFGSYKPLSSPAVIEVNKVAAYVLSPNEAGYMAAAILALSACWYDLYLQLVSKHSNTPIFGALKAVHRAVELNSFNKILRDDVIQVMDTQWEGTFECKFSTTITQSINLDSPHTLSSALDPARCSGAEPPVAVYYHHASVTIVEPSNPQLGYQQFGYQLMYTWPPGPTPDLLKRVRK